MKKQNLKKNLVFARKTVSSLNGKEVTGGALSGNFACTRTNKVNCATELTYTQCAGCNSWYC